MTKCLSCGHLRHDLELNCPKCGSFYSTMVDDFSTEGLQKNQPNNILGKIKTHLEHPRHRLFAIGMVIFLVMVVLFL